MGFGNIFFELSLVIFLAGLFGLILKRLSQPLLLAYILAGFSISFLSLTREESRVAFSFFGEIGIALLLFMVGIELSLTELKTLGKTVLWAGTGQILAHGILGFILARLLGFDLSSSIYLALAITFSSTIVVVKLLGEKKDLNALYGKISVGILLLQDLFAVLILMILAGVFQETFSSLTLFSIIFKGGLFFLILILATKKVLPFILSLSASSLELLLLVSLAWAFVIASIALAIGFSLEIGAFLAGVALATSVYRFQILSKLRPLRDFFIVLFFVALGLQINIFGLLRLFTPSLIFALFVIFSTPLLLLLILGKILGQKKRTAFLTGISLAQISEFSIILVVLGERLGHISFDVVSIVAMTAILTILASSLLIIRAGSLYHFLSPYLSFFERPTLETKIAREVPLANHTILVGCEQMGQDLLKFLEGRKEQFVVVDFNPTIIRNLISEKVECIFGDISDPEILDELNLESAKLIISTVPDLEDNLSIIAEAKKRGFRGILILCSYWAEDGIKLYNQGADYVIVPEFIGGKHLARILSDHWQDLSEIQRAKDKHLQELLEKRISH
jgi:Kef-type K+ transport system membrane component KefB